MKACATLESMPSVYSITATGEHYACMVDLLSCVGHLYKAEDMIKNVLWTNCSCVEGLAQCMQNS
jgi:hypothetical protein